MIRLAVAGMAHSHVRCVFDEVAARPEVRLVAVSEPDPVPRETYAEYTAGVPIYQDHRELLAEHEVDVVAVCGIFGQRADAVVAALRSGAHVLADKPLCTSLEQLAAIETAAAETGRIVSIMFEKRGQPVTLAARRLVADGVLGELTIVASTGPHQLQPATRPAWFFTREYGGILADIAVPDVDLFLAFTGATAGYVVGTVDNRTHPEYPEFTDHGAMLLVTDEARATIDASWLVPETAPDHGPYEMRLVGTRGTAHLRWSDGQLDLATHDHGVWQERLPAGQRPAQDLITALLAGTAPEVGTAQSLAVTRIALLAQRSAERQGAVEHWKTTL